MVQANKSSLENLKTEAWDYVSAGNTSAYFSQRANVFVLFKPNSEGLMKFAYVCPECSREESGEKDFQKPYTITCSKCSFEIFKQEKVKGKRKPRKKKE